MASRARLRTVYVYPRPSLITQRRHRTYGQSRTLFQKDGTIPYLSTTILDLKRSFTNLLEVTKEERTATEDARPRRHATPDTAIQYLKSEYSRNRSRPASLITNEGDENVKRVRNIFDDLRAEIRDEYHGEWRVLVHVKLSCTAKPATEHSIAECRDAALIPPLGGPGLVVVTTGLLRACTNNHMLAFMIGHELSHLIDEHAAKQQAIFKDLTNEERDQMRPEQEYIADKLGATMAAKAGYDPRGARQALRLFQIYELRRYQGKARPL
ncbi:hypothetical protein HYALB_00003851 [Hymenoscyphus albidus]|uniref:Peptidase M48 domain-containing protein n=1 Tax=Hymenoscyphus albidus TaxID=595503 RepID=A0A9N9Q098_9HELO|nr:hypothetical protein HYALB_00003851 [Hymenoscyphus albidus]